MDSAKTFGKLKLLLVDSGRYVYSTGLKTFKHSLGLLCTPCLKEGLTMIYTA